MLLSHQSLSLQDSLKAMNPFTGMNWSEVRAAYVTFFQQKSVEAINHIIAAGRNSNWNHWVNARRARLAAPLAGIKVSINIPELMELPESTLGGAYARHIVYQGLDPEAFMDTSNTDENWLGQRMAFSHDVYHAITGFNGTVLGEYGLAAFCFAQFGDSLNAFVLSCLPYVLIPNFKQTHKFIGAIIKGLIMGFKSKPLVAYQFEANWDKSLAEVRQELGISEFFLA